MRLLIRVLLLGAVSFALFTWWALESSGVAIIETRMQSGSLRFTHVWFVEPTGELWIEAGTPENGWYVDVQTESAITFATDGRSGKYNARPIRDPRARTRIRTLLREKYGIRDRWIGLVFDTRKSISVRLFPAEEHVRGTRSKNEPALTQLGDIRRSLQRE